MKIRLLASVLPAMLLAACASSPTVHTDSAPGTNFTTYQTYTWLETGKDAPDPLHRRRIVEEVETRLWHKGMRRAGFGETADVGLAAHVSTQEKQTLNAFYDTPAWAGWGWSGLATTTTTATTAGGNAQPVNYQTGTLVLDMFDLKSKQAVWRGTANSVIADSPHDHEEDLGRGIQKMFAGFPPGDQQQKQ